MNHLPSGSYYNIIIRTYLLSDAQNSAQDAPSSDASLQVAHLAARLVHVKGANDDESWLRRKVSQRDRDLLGDVLAEHLDVVLELRGDGHDGRSLGDRALHELGDLLVLLLRLTLFHQIDLVLQDQDVLQLHDLDGREMFARLRLWTALVTCTTIIDTSLNTSHSARRM